MTAASFLPNGKQQFLDQNGRPLASGAVYFYIPNTTTFKTTWQDPDQVTENTNPVQLDAGGFAIIYGAGEYRQVVKDAFGTTVWDELSINYGVLDEDDMASDSQSAVPTQASVKAYVDSAVAASQLTVKPIDVTSYTPELDDGNAKLLQTTNSGSVGITIPTNSSVPFQVGTILNLEQGGTGTISVTGDTGVTIGTLAGAAAQTYSQNALMQVIKVGTNSWIVTLGNGSPGYRWGSRQVFSVAGTFTYERPAGCRAAFVRLVGGGGGGQGAVAGNSAGGGGAGGYSEKFVTNLQAAETVVVGAAGVAGNSSGIGSGAGGSSSFGTHCSATGGAAGASTTNAAGGVGSGGDVNGLGGPGQCRNNGTGADNTSGNGGDSAFSGGGQGGSPGALSVGGSGQAGSGGGGAYGGGSGASGGTGGAGLVLVDEYY